MAFSLLDTPAELRREPAFLLYTADFSRIQRFIYTVHTEGALRSLRSRSFFLELLMEHYMDELLDAILRGLRILDYSLHTVSYPIKNTRIPGFVGSAVVEARLALPLLELWNALLSFAPYGGIGIKTTLGMGGVSVEPLVLPQRSL